MEIELENPFGLHAPTRLHLDPGLDVEAVLARVRAEHGLDCNRLFYRGRLLKPGDVLGQFIDPSQSNKIVTHVSAVKFQAGLPASPPRTISQETPNVPAPNQAGMPVPVRQAVARPPQPGLWQQWREYIDLSLLGRLAFFVVILGSDASVSKRMIILSIAVIIYIYQVATRTPAPENELLPGAVTPVRNPETPQGIGQMGYIELIERFLVGLFASLYPGWNPA